MQSPAAYYDVNSSFGDEIKNVHPYLHEALLNDGYIVAEAKKRPLIVQDLTATSQTTAALSPDRIVLALAVELHNPRGDFDAHSTICTLNKRDCKSTFQVSPVSESKRYHQASTHYSVQHTICDSASSEIN